MDATDGGISVALLTQIKPMGSEAGADAQLVTCPRLLSQQAAEHVALHLHHVIAELADGGSGMNIALGHECAPRNRPSDRVSRSGSGS